MTTANNPDQLSKEIIFILENYLDKEFDEEEIKTLLKSTNGQFLKSVFESYLQSHWECDISSLHTLVDRINSLPCELIPTGLFGAASSASRSASAS